MICGGCNKDFPVELIHRLVIGKSSTWLCPICALKKRNEAAGLPPETEFDGEEARRLHREAKKHLKATGQES